METTSPGRPSGSSQVISAPLSEVDDVVLVKRLRDGDSAAFTAIMAKYMNRLTRFAFLILGSRDLADDVVQHVFVRLWERRSVLRPDSQLRAYLFHVVRNRALNEQRNLRIRERHQANVQADCAAGSYSSAVSNPEDEILTNTTVQSAIEQLPERRRLALRLRIREELSHAEIAKILDISPMAAQRLVARAIADLRKKIWDV